MAVWELFYNEAEPCETMEIWNRNGVVCEDYASYKGVYLDNKEVKAFFRTTFNDFIILVAIIE